MQPTKEQREIKFKWEFIHWWFVYWYYLYTAVFSNTNDYYKHIIITDKWEIREIKEWTQWQYTWLKDKNWKDIYEGDLLQTLPFNWIWLIYEVVFDNDIAWFVAKWVDNQIDSWDIWNHYKIIWNIYENPELLSNTSGS